MELGQSLKDSTWLMDGLGLGLGVNIAASDFFNGWKMVFYNVQIHIQYSVGYIWFFTILGFLFSDLRGKRYGGCVGSLGSEYPPSDHRRYPFRRVLMGIRADGPYLKRKRWALALKTQRWLRFIRHFVWGSARHYKATLRLFQETSAWWSVVENKTGIPCTWWGWCCVSVCVSNPNNHGWRTNKSGLWF